MEKFTAYEKMSKKNRRKIDLAKRNDWSGLNPVTRVADTDAKKYRRKPKYPDKYL